MDQDFDDYYDDDLRPHVRGSLPHSGLGIVSFVMAITGGIASLGLFVIAGLAAQHLKEDHPALILLGLAFIGIGLLAMIGAILAGIGLTDQRRNRAFAVVGLVLNCLLVLGVIGLTIIGMLSD